MIVHWCTLLATLTMLAGCVGTKAVRSTVREVRAQELIDEGTVRLRAFDLAGAEGAFGVALELAPSAQAVDGLGCVRLLAGRFQEAEVLFRRALRLDPAYEAAYGNLALLYEIQGEHRPAELLYRAALKGGTMNYRVRNNFGAFLYDREEVERARITLEKAKALTSHPVVERNVDTIRSRMME